MIEQKQTLFVVLVVLASSFFVGGLSSPTVQQDDEDAAPRGEKILNMFSVVRFANGNCAATIGKNGTCYAQDECTEKGGSGSGSCASGYGICCVFTLGCGGTAAENCTYFESIGSEVGACRATICPCSEFICQLRLDFTAFTINQPATGTTSTIKASGKTYSTASQCNTDNFSVTSPGNNPPPVICGSNTGDHMYVDASDECNDMVFNLASGTSTVTRTWSIKITQYKCDYENLAPDGCTSYFFGGSSGQVKTFNFDGGHHLADQDHNICVRRELSMCKICWATQATIDFQTSGKISGQGSVKSGCCNYGTGTAHNTIYDCAVIPSAEKTAGSILAIGAAHGFCGLLLVATTGTTAATICSKKVPFNIRFISDHYEVSAASNEASFTPNGFKLIYTMTGC